MGNRSSTEVTAGVKDQAAGGDKFKLYSLVNTTGEGSLVENAKICIQKHDFTELDELIRTEVGPYLYNNGQGKMIPIQELVIRRNKERGNKIKGSIKENMETTDTDSDDIEKMKNGQEMKFVCWDLDKRGAVGEQCLHTCILVASATHTVLAKRLLTVYPKLIYDIYTSEEYYGENALHMAIVNEDPAMCKYLLDNGADYHQICCGNFFCPDDQKSSRVDNLDHEWVDLCVKTNYEGYTYWGDYPLGFAACLGQEECVRLLIAKGSDPNKQDANLNTVLHILVVHDKKNDSPLEDETRHEILGEMFDLLHSLGAKMHIKNRQGLTPLTLAAKLGRKEMYEHILEIEREVYWIYGDVTCAAYPLEDIDTISASGEINMNSAMARIVYGEEPSHLDMIDGIVEHLLQEKWKTFARYRFIRRFLMFGFYFIIFTCAFFLRPGTDTQPSYKMVNQTDENDTVTTRNVTVKDPCYLLLIRSNDDYARLVLECMTVLGASIYLFLALKEVHHQGVKIFFMTLRSAPVKTMFLMACIFVTMMVPGRAFCQSTYEDVMGVLAILCTAPYFLFFCRGFKIVGPFVIMIYKMILTDLLRFITIYCVFLIGFSQSMYILFRGKDGTAFSAPEEAIMGMFVMSLGEFGDTYSTFSHTCHPVMTKIIFVVYMVLVTLLLINMLIAMMGNTYQLISETKNEYLRQWAKIILVIEQTVTTEQRILQQKKYSHPMADGRRALVIRWHQTEKEKEDLKRLRKEQIQQQRALVEKKRELNKPNSRPVSHKNQKLD
ncbi:unnamed protein product [Owenia fusiformis]|uniref:Ion transport domain-containing protein n=1 Tax=Owenia fusiformis TaxID=6347 RepID=A0A8J1T8N1_OWEFU|nr:unnamed protein product [Owenia fusiformis]